MVAEEKKAILTTKNLTVAYNGTPVLWQVSANFSKGKMTAIVGPNGAGKSTLIKTTLDFMKAQVGSVHYHFTGIEKELNMKDIKDKVAYVPQKSSVDWDFPTRVIDVALMGRYGKLGIFKRPKKEDQELAYQMLEKVEMNDFSNRQISELSGGQRQRVFLARALTQQAELYILDEPLAGVDIKTEKIVMDLLRQLCKQGKSVIVVHHDLFTVEKYFDNVILLNREIISQGPVQEVFTEDNIHQTYYAKQKLDETQVGDE